MPLSSVGGGVHRLVPEYLRRQSRCTFIVNKLRSVAKEDGERSPQKTVGVDIDH